MYVKNFVDDLIQSTSGILKGFTRRIFSQSVTSPIWILTVPFVQFWTISNGPLNGVSYLKSFFP